MKSPGRVVRDAQSGMRSRGHPFRDAQSGTRSPGRAVRAAQSGTSIPGRAVEDAQFGTRKSKNYPRPFPVANPAQTGRPRMGGTKGNTAYIALLACAARRKAAPTESATGKGSVGASLPEKIRPGRVGRAVQAGPCRRFMNSPG